MCLIFGEKLPPLSLPPTTSKKNSKMCRGKYSNGKFFDDILALRCFDVVVVSAGKDGRRYRVAGCFTLEGLREADMDIMMPFSS